MPVGAVHCLSIVRLALCREPNSRGYRQSCFSSSFLTLNVSISAGCDPCEGSSEDFFVARPTQIIVTAWVNPQMWSPWGRILNLEKRHYRANHHRHLLWPTK
ncbi:hypothetical protein K449DRAFT_51092 [Hypoxylon sp. EC38]|nr:hypothetical protein K449DRAFT_51092 [Hypoxylon sp. EC38]